MTIRVLINVKGNLPTSLTVCLTPPYLYVFNYINIIVYKF